MEIIYNPVRRDLNLKRYKIDLADVEDVFTDIFALTQVDRVHGDEQFVTLGTDCFGRLLVVAYTYGEENGIRVVSARHANPHERRCYEEG
ncbi:MAG: BrnT family toxin [Betaproteobacteria bacterium]|nr:BrnT family toxin [Betaproteobacteria bacterium]